MQFWWLFLLFFFPFFGGFAGLTIRSEKTRQLKLFLAFSGAFLISITILNLIPEVYDQIGNQAGYYILGGFFLQIVVDFFSKGIEHGHLHFHEFKKGFPVSVFLALSLHAFIEGLGLGGDAFSEATQNNLVFAIGLHELPAAFALAVVLIDAFYKLDNPGDQITSFIFDVVRAEVPKLILDDVFLKKDDIAVAVKSELQDAMSEYGYQIIKTLVTDIDPDAQVKEAMNRINASEREKVAAQFEGEAQKILIVEKAKAEAESKRLQGQGIADQRREIARGLEDSVKVLNGVDINSQEASALIVVTQHYDTLQSVGAEANSNLILLPNSPQAGSEMLNNMVASFTASNQIGEEMKKARMKKKGKDTE